MATTADRYTDKTFSQLESRISKMYKEAQKDLRKKLEDFTRHHKAKDAEMRRKLKAGEITQAQYQQWITGQVFVGNQWKQKIEQVNNYIKGVMQNASNLTHGKSMDVFAENANHTAYQLEKDLKANINFGLYDTATVSRLVGKDPEVLPRRVVNGRKLEAWETKKISNAISQGIIQGEGIDQIADRIARDTCIAADKSSVMYARTAMTCAQNAGMMERLHEAEEMGIKVKKRWMAVLDDRTRDSHRDLDGETVDIDEKFSNGLMHPGDPSTNDFAEICNCRCTMVYVYPEFKQSFERSASLGYDEEGHKQYETVGDMTYREWEASKKSTSAPVPVRKEVDQPRVEVVVNPYAGINQTSWGVFKNELPEDVMFDIEDELIANRGDMTVNEYWRSLVNGDVKNSNIERLLTELQQDVPTKPVPTKPMETPAIRPGVVPTAKQENLADTLQRTKVNPDWLYQPEPGQAGDVRKNLIPFVGVGKDFDLDSKLSFDYYTKTVSTKTNVEIDLSKLKTLQPLVTKTGVERALAGGAGMGNPVKVVEYKGQFYILDGNHRANAAKLLKQKTIRVTLIRKVDK